MLRKLRPRSGKGWLEGLKDSGIRFGGRVPGREFIVRGMSKGETRII